MSKHVGVTCDLPIETLDKLKSFMNTAGNYLVVVSANIVTKMYYRLISALYPKQHNWFGGCPLAKATLI